MENLITSTAYSEKINNIKVLHFYKSIPPSTSEITLPLTETGMPKDAFYISSFVSIASNDNGNLPVIQSFKNYDNLHIVLGFTSGSYTVKYNLGINIVILYK